MKRPTMLLTRITFILMLTVLVSCNQVQKPNEPDKNDKPTVEAPAQIVEVSQAKNMYDSYSKRRVPLIQHYKILKQYLKFIEQEAADANVEISTLRLYYSNYPDDVFFPNSKDSIKHPRQNSIMLSPTYNDGKRDYLFYIGQGAKGKQAVPLNNDFENIKGYSIHTNENNKAHASFAPISKIAAKPLNIQGQQSLTLNRGSGVPPPKN